MRRALAALALAPLLAGCQTTQERSAALEKAALRSRPKTSAPTTRTLRPSRQVKVLATTLVHGSEGYAAVVTLQNETAKALQTVPIAIEAKDAGGAVVYSNRGPGLAASLVSLAYLPPHARVNWVDDQVQATGAPASLAAEVGEAPTFAGSPPALAIDGVRAFEDPANGPGAEGTVANGSGVEQRELVIYAVARKAGQIVAAGRAVLPQLAAHANGRFQAYLVGSPTGASLQATAPPTTLP